MAHGKEIIHFECLVQFDSRTIVLSPLWKGAIDLFKETQRRFIQAMGDFVEIGDGGVGGGGFDFTYEVSADKAKDAEAALRLILAEFSDSLQITIETVEPDDDDDTPTAAVRH